MSDINFFSSFEKIKKDQKKKTRKIWGVILGAILIIVLGYGFLNVQILYLNQEIQAGQDYLNDAEVKNKLTQLEAIKEANQNLRKYDTETGVVLQNITRSNKVSSTFLDTFQKAFPRSVSLKSLTLKDTQLTMQGNAPLWTTTAELTHNLEDSGLFSRVQVNSLTQNKEGNTYLFDIRCDLKEVAAK